MEEALSLVRCTDGGNTSRNKAIGIGRSTIFNIKSIIHRDSCEYLHSSDLKKWSSSLTYSPIIIS